MMGLSIGVYEILGSRDVWYFLHHQHHRPPQSSHRNDESLISGTILGVRWAPTSSLRPFGRSGRVTQATMRLVVRNPNSPRNPNQSQRNLKDFTRIY